MVLFLFEEGKFFFFFLKRDYQKAEGKGDCERHFLLTFKVHPWGQYGKNHVVGILQAKHGLAPLFLVYRLHRLVSGLLILAISTSKANRFRQ